MKREKIKLKTEVPAAQKLLLPGPVSQVGSCAGQRLCSCCCCSQAPHRKKEGAVAIDNPGLGQTPPCQNACHVGPPCILRPVLQPPFPPPPTGSRGAGSRQSLLGSAAPAGRGCRLEATQTRMTLPSGQWLTQPCLLKGMNCRFPGSAL